MRFFYDCIFLFYAIAYLPVLLFKGKLHRNFLERFGIFDSRFFSWCVSHDKILWIHAVSVGEVSASRPIVERLKTEFPAYGIVVSTTTQAGNHLAKGMLSEDAAHEPSPRMQVIYFPLDVSAITRRVVHIVKPDLFLMMETELWPNLIMALSEKRVPIILLNGRISDKSFGWYKAAAFFMKPAVVRIDRFCMQSETDAERIRSIGAQPEKVRLTGNLKFDVISAKTSGSGRDARSRPGITKKSLCVSEEADLIVAGSTHNPEEDILIRIYRELLKKYPRIRLLIAPRHIERIDKIEVLVKRSGFIPERVSHLGGGQTAEGKAAGSETVLLLDTIGQLKDIYASATIVFMGGSLMKKGGHNLIEPALYARAIVFGPHMFNFRDMADLFIRNKAAVAIGDEKALCATLERLLNNAPERQEMGDNARRLIQLNFGATDRTMGVIREVFRPR